MVDCIKGFGYIKEDCAGFEAFDGVLGLLAANVAKLGSGVYYFKMFH